MRHTKGGMGVHNKRGEENKIKDVPLNTHNVAYMNRHTRLFGADQPSDGLRDGAALTGESGSGTSQV